SFSRDWSSDVCSSDLQSSWSGTQYSLPVEPGTPTLPLKAWVTEDAARAIAAKAGQDLDRLRDAARARGFKAVPLGIRASAVLRRSGERRVGEGGSLRW